MVTSLYQLITDIQNGNKNALMNVINKFSNLIRKLSRNFDYEESETDLIIELILILNNINLSKFSNLYEGSLVNYLNNSLKNKSTDLFRKYVLNQNNELSLDLDIISYSEDMDTKLFVDDLVKVDALTDNQKYILKQHYYYGYSDLEIAKKLNISRQAVNKSKQRALSAIRKYLKE